MGNCKRLITLILTSVMVTGFYSCSKNGNAVEVNSNKSYIEQTLNLANNKNQEWKYDSDSDAWILSSVSAVAYLELPDQQGVSVCVPGAYVKGIDTTGDGKEDITSSDINESAKGSLVIDYDTKITSTNGQVYTASTAPVIINTGAAGYGSQNNSDSSTKYAADGYINISCGNRGKKDTAIDVDGNMYYTGDAPSCLVDQKSAARYIKYNILLGNLPGNIDYFISTGGSGGGAHATMFAVTGDSSDFYDYQIEAGAVGVYKNDDGSYSTTVTINGEDYDISDGAWGCIAYSAITPLYEADMALAFEYYLNSNYSFKTPFQKQLAEYLSENYMKYINDQNISVKESDVGFDLNGDGKMESEIKLTIQYDPENYPETNGYYGTYLDLYLAEFTQNLQWYLDNLNYANDWTWFDSSGNALSDDEVSKMTNNDKVQAFIEGRYTRSNKKGIMGRPNGDPAGGIGNGPREMNEGPANGQLIPNENIVGTPDGGTTQSNTGSSDDSLNYATYTEMVNEYESDIKEIYSGDKYGNNIVNLYNPMMYIGIEDGKDPTWTKIIMGASEGDISMLNSLNLQIALLNAGVYTELEWQWDGGHVPSETLGNSFSLYVDQMYGKYINDAIEITKAEPEKQIQNGTSENPSGIDISSWVSLSDSGIVSLSLKDVTNYRTEGASKAIPGFDVIDYGQEDYVFGSSEKDARHWNKYLLNIFKEHADVLEPLFNSESK